MVAGHSDNLCATGMDCLCLSKHNHRNMNAAWSQFVCAADESKLLQGVGGGSQQSSSWSRKAVIEAGMPCGTHLIASKSYLTLNMVEIIDAD